MGLAEITTAVLLVAGCVVALTAGLGALRLPDFFSRLHPAGKGDSLAQLLILGWSFSPLRRVEREVAEVESGTRDALSAGYPSELHGLTNGLNRLLETERRQMARYRDAMSDLAHSLTVANASSTERTLTTMLVIAGIGMPLVLGYTFFIYRTFKGKVEIGPDSY